MRLAERLRNSLSRTHVVAEGRGAGLKLSASHADANFARGTYERPVQEALVSNLRQGDVFYDIGANIGFFSNLAARQVGGSGRVYAFEPVPSNAAAIVRSSRLNGIDTIEVIAEAVGAKTGRAELVLARHIGGAALASAEAPPDPTGRIEVAVTTLDDAVKQRAMRPPSLVKIDVEGAEIDVLRGMTQTLASHRPTVIYEVDSETRDGLARKAGPLAELLSAAGYEITSLPNSYPDIAWHVEHAIARPRRCGCEIGSAT